MGLRCDPLPRVLHLIGFLSSHLTRDLRSESTVKDLVQRSEEPGVSYTGCVTSPCKPFLHRPPEVWVSPRG